jgi:hypothetical protein
MSGCDRSRAYIKGSSTQAGRTMSSVFVRFPKRKEVAVKVRTGLVSYPLAVGRDIPFS